MQINTYFYLKKRARTCVCKKKVVPLHAKLYPTQGMEL